MSYEITGDRENGFVVQFSERWGRITVCPCCDKPLDERWKAEQLAVNLQRISDGVERHRNDGQAL